MGKEKLVEIYTTRDSFTMQHLANHLEYAGIEYQILGDRSATVLGVDNYTQEISLRVFQNDVIQAKNIIEKYINQQA